MQEQTELQTLVDTILYGKTSYRLLEAGCGSASHLSFKSNVYRVGIDISEKQLQRNTDLNEEIQGDIQEYDLQPSSFDVIVCWDVLEHLSNPQKALERFARAIKDEGIIILKLPNVLSLKGLLTKFLPHPFHVMYYRYYFGNRYTCREGSGPFKTYLRLSIAPNAIKKFAANNGLRIIYFKEYDILNSDWFLRKKMACNIYKALKTFVGFMSFGNLSDSDFVIVLMK